ncbi:sigma-70 family RNA polymerase sigma factor [Streptomyces griseorubiginosus]|jgi:RNA polymerase sigma-70 factor (ECF subfamily)|uniref:sigma-70 family RNA polymerase sigma factor n=1 Tax=Streptomyces TaxID=1883 RepID=UPI00076D5E31|nr:MULTISPECIES: sigma-70 family RNA polymerase sigma factor [Streptomyces]KUM75092.1 RNA polymerase subunit sigma-70 [Streptomyces griseorubiginosus]TCR19458.1 RNA polymerase sigma-70 factor (ECF subfamily) [Streptomyces sp. BK205]
MNVTAIGSASAVSPEERALRDLYLEHGPALYSYVLRMLDWDTHRAEDILQETLLRCWSNGNLADAEGMAVRPWMFRVARNLVIDAHRTRMARPLEISDTSWLGDMHAEVDDIERMLSSIVLHKALESLTPAHREVLRATFFADRTTQQAAEDLGIPRGTVKSRVYYALRSLRLALRELGVVVEETWQETAEADVAC